MRKANELKRIAKERMFTKYGALAGGTAILGALYFIIVMALVFAYSMQLLTSGALNSVEAMEEYIMNMNSSYTSTLIIQGVAVLVGALMSTVTVALQYMCLNTARMKEVKLSDLLFVVKNNPDKVIVIFLIQNLLSFLFALPANILAMSSESYLNTLTYAILYLVFMIISYAADIIVAVLFSQAMFVYLDNPQENVFVCIQTSAKVMKKHFWRYVCIVLSFIPLNILAVFTMCIAYIYVLPYQYTVMSLFYMELKGELGSVIDVTVQ